MGTQMSYYAVSTVMLLESQHKLRLGHASSLLSISQLILHWLDDLVQSPSPSKRHLKVAVELHSYSCLRQQTVEVFQSASVHGFLLPIESYERQLFCGENVSALEGKYFFKYFENKMSTLFSTSIFWFKIVCSIIESLFGHF